jgi:diguanylate cyclase (GGDEF)-like protein
MGKELTYEVFLDCVHPDDKEYVDKKWKAALDKEPYDIEHRIIVNNQIKWVREIAELEFNEKGNVIRGIGAVQDITDRKLLEQKLQELVLIDELTKLRNRRGFVILSEQQIKIAKRNNIEMSLLFIDIDNMKLINDKFGHLEGDKALIAIAAVIKNTCRESDIIARIGGDEFVILGVDMCKGSCDNLIGRLQENLNNYNAKILHPYKLSISFGIVTSDPANPRSIDELINQADKLMYEQKQKKLKANN